MARASPVKLPSEVIVIDATRRSAFLCVHILPAFTKKTIPLPASGKNAGRGIGFQGIRRIHEGHSVVPQLGHTVQSFAILPFNRGDSQRFTLEGSSFCCWKTAVKSFNTMSSPSSISSVSQR